MPRKNVLKTYVKDSYYHLYNRGVNKSDIFLDKSDYIVFLRYLKEYLLPPNHIELKKLLDNPKRRNPINCYEDIDLFAYCLMPNHFHLFVKQKTSEGLKPFMRALGTNYVMYFNHKYNRTGPLFESRYKAALITDEPHFIHITRYIHRNPIDIARERPLQYIREYPYSSYKYYLKGSGPYWLNLDATLKRFDYDIQLFPNAEGVNSYQHFVENYNLDDRKILEGIKAD